MNIYESKNYKLLLIIPLIVLIFALFFSTSVKQGIDLRGGILITVPVGTEVDVSALQTSLTQQFDLEDVNVRAVGGSTTGIIVEFVGETTLLQAQEAVNEKDYATVIELSKQITGELNLQGDQKDQADIYFSKARETFKNNIMTFIASETGANKENFSVQDIGPSLGAIFLGQALKAVVIAFLFISLLIFYYFRVPIVSFAVIQSALFDVLVGYAALGLLNIPLSLATIAPLLMLIGYSVDTDIMLTDRLIKRKNATPQKRALSAFKTGMTMTTTTLLAMGSLAIVSYYANITVLFNVSIIMILGLLADIIGTWCTNITLVLWYLERKEKRKNK